MGVSYGEISVVILLNGNAVFIWDKSAVQKKRKAILNTLMNTIVLKLKIDLHYIKYLSALTLLLIQDRFNICFLWLNVCSNCVEGKYNICLG